MSTWMLLLMGCWDPTSTGPTGMVGKVFDADGTPVAGQRIETLEAEKETGPDGSFTLQYKAPNQLVHLHRGGLWYKRLYRPEDDGKIVDLRLPATRELPLDCGPCDGTLSVDWDLAEGLLASQKLDCQASSVAVVPVHPNVLRASCRGNGEQQVELSWDEAALRVVPPPRLVRIELTTEPDPSGSCEVFVDATKAEAVEPGLFQVEVRGRGWARVRCDERPALPVAVEDQDAVTIAWTQTGWDLRSTDAFEAEALHLTNGRWWLRHVPQPDGSYLLPPLPPGRYGVVLSSELESPVSDGWNDAETPDALVVRHHPSGAMVGQLWISGEREPGELGLSRAPDEPSPGR